MSMGAFKAAMNVYMYISYKCGGLLSSSLLLKLMLLNCVQQVLISTWVNSSTSRGGSTFVFCYYSLGGDTAMPGRLYARLCHAFLVIFFCTVISHFCFMFCYIEMYCNFVSITVALCPIMGLL